MLWVALVWLVLTLLTSFMQLDLVHMYATQQGTKEDFFWRLVLLAATYYLYLVCMWRFAVW